jgi:hypothetical protein
MYISHHVKYLSFLKDFNELEFCRQVFEKQANMKFHENPSSGSQAALCGERDGHKEAKRRLSQFCEGA